MREIKFRGKRKDNGEWVDGFLFVPSNSNRHYIITGYLEGGVPVIKQREVDPETVGQFTGRTVL